MLKIFCTFVYIFYYFLITPFNWILFVTLFYCNNVAQTSYSTLRDCQRVISVNNGCHCHSTPCGVKCTLSISFFNILHLKLASRTSGRNFRCLQHEELWQWCGSHRRVTPATCDKVATRSLSHLKGRRNAWHSCRCKASLARRSSVYRLDKSVGLHWIPIGLWKSSHILMHIVQVSKCAPWSMSSPSCHIDLGRFRPWC